MMSDKETTNFEDLGIDDLLERLEDCCKDWMATPAPTRFCLVFHALSALHRDLQILKVKLQVDALYKKRADG